MSSTAAQFTQFLLSEVPSVFHTLCAPGRGLAGKPRCWLNLQQLRWQWAQLQPSLFWYGDRVCLVAPGVPHSQELGWET